MKGVLLLAALRRAQAMETDAFSLLNLKSHWIGNGMSHFAHGIIRVLSSKLDEQCGQVSSYLPLPGGKSWTLRATFSLQCEQPTESGLSLVLSQANLIQPHQDYSCETYASSFGAYSNIKGVAMTLYKDTVYVAYLEDDTAGVEQLLDWGTPCKTAQNTQMRDVSLIVRYRGGNLSVYLFDALTNSETLCRQFVDLPFLEEFYLTVAGSARGRGCSGTLSHADFISAAKPVFIAEEFKKPNTPEFAVFQNFTSKNYNLQHFYQAYSRHREHAKILAQELLSFADKNEKEVGDDLSASYNGYLGNLTASLEVIERETRQISALSSLLLENRHTKYQQSGEVLNSLLLWLEDVEKVYDTTMNSTRRIYEGVKDFTFDTQLATMMNHTDSILSGLKGLFKQAMEGVSQGEDVTLQEDWTSKLGSFAEKFNTTLKQKLSHDPSSALQNLGMVLLSGLAVLIFFAFGYLYWKVKRAAEFKRIL